MFIRETFVYIPNYMPDIAGSNHVDIFKLLMFLPNHLPGDTIHEDHVSMYLLVNVLYYHCFKSLLLIWFFLSEFLRRISGSLKSCCILH